MDYQPDRFSVSRRDVIAAWVVCAVSAALVFLYGGEKPGSDGTAGNVPVAQTRPAAPPPTALCAITALTARHG